MSEAILEAKIQKTFDNWYERDYTEVHSGIILDLMKTAFRAGCHAAMREMTHTLMEHPTTVVENLFIGDEDES